MGNKGADRRWRTRRTSLGAPIHHAALLDQDQPLPYILHGAYYLKDRESRPHVWYLGAMAPTGLSTGRQVTIPVADKSYLYIIYINIY